MLQYCKLIILALIYWVFTLSEGVSKFSHLIHTTHWRVEISVTVWKPRLRRESAAQITQLLWSRARVHTQVLLTPKSEQVNTQLYSGLCKLLPTKTFSLVKCKLLESICKIAHWGSIWLFCKITNVVISVPWCLWVQLKEKCLFGYTLFAVRTKAQYVFTWVFTAKKLGQARC